MATTGRKYSVTYSPQGLPVFAEVIDDMRFPYRCERCGCVHDVATVTVLRRYADCSVWECPGCGAHIDDRPVSWGGSATPIRD